MAIRAKGKRFQVDKTVNRKRLPRYTFDTEHEAALWEAEAVAATLAGRPLPCPNGSKSTTVRDAGTITFSKAARECWERRWAGTRSGRWYGQNIDQMERFFGKSLTIRSIDTAMVDDFLLHLSQEGRSDSTINRKIATLSVIFRYARSRGWIRDIPEMRRRREGRHRIRWLTPKEERGMLECFRAWSLTDHRDAFVVFIDTGLRMGELWRLEARDIMPARDRGQGAITIWQSKTDQPRTIPLTNRAADVLRRRAENHDNGPLFPNLTNHSYRAGWRRAADRLGLIDDPQFVPYASRHTFASRLVQRGVSLQIVQQLLGHTTLSMTQRYAHLAPINFVDAINTLEDA